MMKARCVLLILVLAAICGSAVSAVVVDQPVGSTPSGLREGIQSWQRAGCDISSSADSARGWLADNGYLDGGVALSGDTLTVSAGKQYLLERVVVGGDSVLFAGGKTSLTRSAVQRVTDELLAGYYRRGYYFARMDVDSLSATDGRATLYVSVIEGPVVTVGQCRPEGLKRTRSDLVVRYLGVQPGDTLTEELLSRANAGASGIPFLRKTRNAEVTPRPGYQQADLVFQFEERQQVSLAGGVGYIADADRKLLFNLDLTLRNLFGDGRTVSWLADHREANNNVMRLSYGQPVLVTGIGWLEGVVQTRDYRNLFYEFGADIGYQARSSQITTIGLNLGYKRVEPAIGPDRYRRYAVELTAARRGADDRFNPTSGLDLHSAITFAYRRYTADSTTAGTAQSLKETQASFSGDLYQNIAGQTLMRVGVGYRGLETSEAMPPVSELLLIGGPGTLRGYRTEQFAVQRAALATVEPRFRFAGGFLYGFCDLAYLNRPVAGQDGSVHADERFRYGYGLGVGLRDVRRSVKLGLAWNPDVGFDQPRVTVELTTDL